MVDDADAPVQWREILVRTYWAPLGVVCLGVWLHAAQGLLVATMVPAIVADIGGVKLIAWAFALYETGSIVAGAACGLLAVRYGTRVPMAAAGSVFAVGCGVSALAPEMWVMLLGRLLQGLGGGGLMAMSYVSVSLLFPKRLMARAMGVVTSIWAVSALLGPLVGGLFVEFAAWRYAFWCFALQGLALAAWMAGRAETMARDPSANRGTGFPVIHVLWLALGVVAVAYAGIEIGMVRTPLFVLVGIGCLWVFLRLDALKGDRRLLPQSPISLHKPVGAGLTMVLCFAGATVALGVYVPFVLTSVHGVSALVAGYVVAVAGLTWTIVAVLLSGAAERNDGRLILMGMVLITVAVAGLGLSVALGSVRLIAVFAALKGAGFGSAWTFIVRRATAIAPVGEVQRVSGAIPTIQRLGIALGAAYVGIVANAAGIDGARPDIAAAVVFLACLPLTLVGLVAARRFVRPA